MHNTGEGGLSTYHRSGADLIYQIGTAYFGCRDEQADSTCTDCGRWSSPRRCGRSRRRQGHRDQAESGRQTRSRRSAAGAEGDEEIAEAGRVDRPRTTEWIRVPARRSDPETRWVFEPKVGSDVMSALQSPGPSLGPTWAPRTTWLTAHIEWPSTLMSLLATFSAALAPRVGDAPQALLRGARFVGYPTFGSAPGAKRHYLWQSWRTDPGGVFADAFARHDGHLVVGEDGPSDRDVERAGVAAQSHRPTRRVDCDAERRGVRRADASAAS